MTAFLIFASHISPCSFHLVHYIFIPRQHRPLPSLSPPSFLISQPSLYTAAMHIICAKPDLLILTSVPMCLYGWTSLPAEASSPLHWRTARGCNAKRHTREPSASEMSLVSAGKLVLREIAERVDAGESARKRRERGSCNEGAFMGSEREHGAKTCSLHARSCMISPNFYASCRSLFPNHHTSSRQASQRGSEGTRVVYR